jgi:hypothetical protein
MLITFRISNRRTLHVIVALSVIVGSSVASWAESNGPLGDSIGRGAGKTIIEGGTGAPTFVPVVTTVAFHAERTVGGVTGAFECLALAPPVTSGPGSGTFTVNVMYVTGTVKTAVVNGDTVTLTGTATITGLGAGNNVPFTFVAREGGPGSNAILTTGGLTFNEIVVEGQFAIGKSKD